ncbi:hypothetical protein [Treponema phagedenis]|uniref:hypothetical protein n=1 Tax=Treponema phagedenis TaxID=162 RepID=UPI00165636F0|nr:hypothetical protein [Treponema phagedenis]
MFTCVRQTEGGERFFKSAKPDPFCAPKIAQKEPQRKRSPQYADPKRGVSKKVKTPSEGEHPNILHLYKTKT